MRITGIINSINYDWFGEQLMPRVLLEANIHFAALTTAQQTNIQQALAEAGMPARYIPFACDTEHRVPMILDVSFDCMIPATERVDLDDGTVMRIRGKNENKVSVFPEKDEIEAFIQKPENANIRIWPEYHGYAQLEKFGMEYVPIADMMQIEKNDTYLQGYYAACELYGVHMLGLATIPDFDKNPEGKIQYGTLLINPSGLAENIAEAKIDPTNQPAKRKGRRLDLKYMSSFLVKGTIDQNVHVAKTIQKTILDREQHAQSQDMV